ncbi:LLM class flavin-dependent oxidoreductase [Streptomyces hirsutus]|uniref:Alkanesulfonate monooxygenase SsuD/methylene tetrahydromethanopterin reductase-like flavin-dependent oxidoreductase (Luciferase family) n=2 Tax=Streptomyces TaxID=1883 RepID=A0A561TYS2_9ACTN|nr:MULTISPECIES: LLM class flavin-dependent oxidoreductase [Streptomyces]TWF92242.1 alkanesulfonate monooxygenase SsuD/methylene tetrahydromethanopterin reductase-like flavin-dependent oxidoreductase (luciferase family) [Streptomyces brevispora]WSD09718.1 LLM class flavin-dependent oxidoreductase [Streptomyces hirsutus]
MGAISDDTNGIKFVHQYGLGLHTTDRVPDVHNPTWQKRQIDDFVEFAQLAEELGFDGLTVTEHHAPLMTCPSPHLLIAAAAVKTSTIRLGTAVTILPLYNPIRVAEEAGTLDLLSGGRFELGIGRGAPGEARIALGRDLSEADLKEAWLESLELVRLLLSEHDVTFDGKYFKVTRPTSIATRPLQEEFPIWLASGSLESMAVAGGYGWSVMRNFGTDQSHKEALDYYLQVSNEHGHDRSAANMMVERFIAIGETEAEAEANCDVFANTFNQFMAHYASNGRSVPKSDGEFAIDKKKDRPALTVVGTPDQIIDQLQEALDATGARRLLVETFTPDQTRLFAREVMPVLRARNAG